VTHLRVDTSRVDFERRNRERYIAREARQVRRERERERERSFNGTALRNRDFLTDVKTDAIIFRRVHQPAWDCALFYFRIATMLRARTSERAQAQRARCISVELARI
jgi:hypothetical protein